MFLIKKFFKLYIILTSFLLVFFFNLNFVVKAAVLTEEDIKYIESVDDNKDKDTDTYIKYEEIEKKKKKLNPFNFFNKSKKKQIKKKKKEIVKKENKIYSEKLKIGVLLPLTGEFSYIGQSFLDTLQMVVYENKNIESELIIKDTKANPSIARKATKELVNEKVNIILGPFFSKSFKEASQIAKHQNIPLISFSNDFKIMKKGVYIMGFEPEKQIMDVTNYTLKKNYERYAALLPNNQYGKRALNIYRQVLGNNKVSLRKVELYNSNSSELERSIQNLVGLEKNPQIEKDEESGENPIENFDPGFDVLLLVETGNTLREVVALLTYYGVDFSKIKLIGTGEWLVDNIGAEPGLLGAWFVAPNPKLWNNFKKKFNKIYGYNPIRLSSLAHDSLISVFSIVRKNDNFYELNYSDFQNNMGFTGIDGDFRFLSNGTVERKLSILEISEKTFKVEKIANKKSF